ncbi:MAG: fumarylacetoacetate hydrolase family protein [Propionibacteriaceae bacterium]|nr:fumarylacetoacetate hydrolase family protein [Propionibacteriaceae bacterium]
MRIARFTIADCQPRYGVVDDGPEPVSITELDGDPFAAEPKLSTRAHWLTDVRLLSPVAPSKVVGVGRNYADHVAEMGSEVPFEPALFLKPSTAVIGPGRSIRKPAATAELHYEGELAVVIARRCRKADIAEVGEYIMGYTVANDVTARDLQRRETQWTRAKGWDTFCPLGPWVETGISLDEAGRLGLRTLVDGEVKQDGNTAQLIRGLAELVAYISHFTTLLPGDVILTGTPSGVGPLEPGQQVSIEIESVGTLTNPVISER